MSRSGAARGSVVRQLIGVLQEIGGCRRPCGTGSLDPDIGDLPQGNVLIEDGRIAAMEREITADAEVIDMTGRIVVPGCAPVPPWGRGPC
ncbi:hypothetical protein [Streptomyces lutosisoli]|uniref:Amidohydrolase 3 domain-containing protein n=1 Tax=Streptomyces lutosisoli TaxID=2665721 RepID=A0ABW2W1I1_9ACTN